MKFVKDLFTGPDGETWAIGRIYSIPTMVTGLAIPIMALFKGQEVSLSELGIGLTGVATAVTVLIYGTRGVDEGVLPSISLTEVPSK